jgi:hypothetical protein
LQAAAFLARTATWCLPLLHFFVLIVILGDAPEVVSMLSGTNHVRKSAPQSANLVVLLF